MTTEKRTEITENKGPEKTEDHTKKKTCFVMMPIADHSDYDPGHFNLVYEYLIKPACKISGYEPFRADDNSASNMIMFDILKKIVECDMAICDLSSRNANVFYELGLRQAFNKKTILITDNRQPPPFDISAFRHIPYSHSLRVDSISREIIAVAKMISETENLPDDDVNSIVKLLQIQPAKVESIDLNKEDSILYSMMLTMQKQISDLGKERTKSSQHYIPDTDNKADVNKELFSGMSFETIYNKYPNILYLLNYNYDNNEIGIINGIDPDEIYFNYKGHITSFENCQEERNKITAE